MCFHDGLQVLAYNLLKEYVGPAPVYPTIGNHDTYMQFQMIPYTMGGPLGTQFNWWVENSSKRTRR
jgi:sphingomyelin phosphodiesterase